MGILNVTPDSFYYASRSFDANAIGSRVNEMINEGEILSTLEPIPLVREPTTSILKKR